MKMRWMTLLALLALMTTASVASAGNKPWTPRKDCSGLYGSKANNSKVKVIKLGDYIKGIKKHKGKTFRVRGRVADVCQKKGCWLMLTDGTNLMRVRFKGYSFFMPTNSKGYGVEVVGRGKPTTLSVGLLRHYAMDAGRPDLAKKITKPKKGIFFMASQVRLYKLKK